jgi:hypothetical protein
MHTEYVISGEHKVDYNMDQYKKPDLTDESIGIPELSINLLPSATTFRTSSLLSKLLPIKDHFVPHSDEELSNNISNGDMIEIDIPVVGNEYIKSFDDVLKENSYESDDEKGFVEINIIPTMTSTTEAPLTAFTELQTSETPQVLVKTSYETTTPEYVAQRTPHSLFAHTVEDMHEIESKLMDHSRPAEYDDQEVIDDPKSPFNVKIVLNNEVSCKNKRSCRQVRYSRNHDIGRQYFINDSDEDFFFENEPEVYSEKRNQLKSRRAADDGFLGGLSLTPAPRMGTKLNTFGGIKKPSFIERLEKETSLERSERVNKELGNLMKFITVWAHVDKFISDRAKSVVRKVAQVADEDFYEYTLLGAQKREKDSKNSILKQPLTVPDEPFT